MSVPVVIVELAPPEAPPALTSALISACSRAVEKGRCGLVSDEPEDAVAHAIAIVSWQGSEQLRVRIEVGIRRAERAQWLARTMSFRAEDDPAERWKAAGLTIATLVGEVAPPLSPPHTGPDPEVEPAETPQPPASQPERSSPPPTDREKPPGREWSGATAQSGGQALIFGLNALVARGIEPGTLRVGGAAAVGYRSTFPIAPLLSTRYAAQAGDSESLAASWWTFGAGGTMGFPIAPMVEIRGRTEIILQRLSVTATDAEQSDSGVQWQPGWLIAADASWAVSRRMSLVVGAEGWATPGSTVIRVRGEEKGNEPAVGVSGRVGAEFALP